MWRVACPFLSGTRTRPCELTHASGCGPGTRVAAVSGRGAGMELGLLSNMLVNSQPYWQAYVPPLFSAIAVDRPNVRTVKPPPVAWAQRSEWKSVRFQIKACDTL